MKTWVRKSLKVGILSAGFLLIGGAAANAASTADNFGVLGGNQVHAPIQAPITVSGNAIGLLGSAQASGSGGSSASGGAGGVGTTSDNFGIGSGNQADVSLLAPVTIAGNAIGGLGSAQASTSGGGSGSASAAASGAGSTSHNFGVLGGNQVHAPVQVPISITGNAIGLLGGATASGSAGGGASANASGGAGSTSDNTGIGSGNQVTPVINVPIDICGNAVSLLGTATADCGNGGGSTGGGSGNGGYGTGSGSGNGGYGTGSGSGSGNGGYGTGSGSGGYAVGTGTGAGDMSGASTAANTAGSTAADLTGTATSALTGTKQHKAKAHLAKSAKKANESAHAATRHATMSTRSAMGGTSRNFGILGGNQAELLLAIPVNVTHNALGLLGTASA